MDDEKEIYIRNPFIEEWGDNVRLCAKVKLYNKEQILWFSVIAQYGEYLTEDRADAFVVVLLTTAMRSARDIVCEAPVTRRLLYQINYYLIPMMASNLKEFHYIKVYAEPTDSVLKCAGAVGTGWTGGVDSMFTYMQNCQSDVSDYRLTHLLITNNGAIEGENARDTLNQMIKKTVRGFAKETGLNVIGVDTNFREVLSEKFVSVVGIRHSAVVLALQRLFSIFLYSSSDAFSEFSFELGDNTKKAEYYEMAILDCLETDCTVFYSSGGAFTRMQKLQYLSDFPLAQKYLHPCVYALRDNCGKCGKCIRVETALYSLGKLDNFSKVFDVEEFHRHKDWYFCEVLKNAHIKHYQEILQQLRQKGIDLSKVKRKIFITLLYRKFIKGKNI